jgi:hypothetical protein
VYLKSMATVPPQPVNVNITNTPPAVSVTNQMPEQKETSITFAPTIEQPVNNIEVRAAEQPAPQIVVNVPEQAAPVVNVETAAPQITNEVTVQPAEVKVDMPKPKRERQKVKRDKKTGMIESTDTEIEY